MTNNNSTSWGHVADWYKHMVEDPNSFQSQVIAPGVLSILGDIADQTLLDVGCGTGFFANIFHERGAKVTGVDIGAESIVLAKQHSPNEIIFTVDDATHLSRYVDNSYNIVVCILALQNIKHGDVAFAEMSRVCKSGGKILLVLNHPSFRIPSQTHWVWSDKEHTQYRRVDSYLTSQEIPIKMQPGANPKNITYSYHHPLQWYSKQAKLNNLVITNVQEWISHRPTDQGPSKTPELERARKEIPMFMALEFSKLS